MLPLWRTSSTSLSYLPMFPYNGRMLTSDRWPKSESNHIGRFSTDICPPGRLKTYRLKYIYPAFSIHSFIHSFILETYIAPLQDNTTQRRSQPSHGQRRRTWGRCKIWKGRSAGRNAAQKGDHSRSLKTHIILSFNFVSNHQTVDISKPNYGLRFADLRSLTLRLSSILLNILNF